MNIKENEKMTNHKTKGTEETKKDKGIKINNLRNQRKRLVDAISITLIISSITFSIVKLMKAIKSEDKIRPFYLRTLIHCRKNPTIVDILGEPINIVKQKNRVEHYHSFYRLGDETLEKFAFDIVGPKGKGLVEAEIKKFGQGKYEYQTLSVMIDTLGTFKIEPKPEDLESLEISQFNSYFSNMCFLN
ncbi:hypothetical protein EAI_04539 [Harpegnathos saltator]|uniref:Mitochondrial import inner membrane translocase subunit Tim21 n=2 Tax=Harpegnathos saltator TaxID=610380 RepID=E2BNC2_HARSA|nr:hypothetical protein EAI_04539 [Harpegnathos saltator]